MVSSEVGKSDFVIIVKKVGFGWKVNKSFDCRGKKNPYPQKILIFYTMALRLPFFPVLTHLSVKISSIMRQKAREKR